MDGGEHVELGYQQMPEIMHVGLSLQHAEHFVNITDNLLVGGEQPLVGIDAGRFLVEVAGTQVGISLDRVIRIVTPFPHVSQFGMYLQPRQAVDYLYACLLHQLGREVVVFLIKTGFQFHEDGHLLAVLGCTDQAVDHSRVFRHTVLRYFDFQYLRVEGGLKQETQQVVERLVGEVQQHILAAQYP